MSKPWVEKYRPRTLADVSAQDEVVRALSDCVANLQRAAMLPHLLFHGPAGTGKTTTALALARQLFGSSPELYSARVKELNASDDRGIQVVREKIKKFAQHSVGSTNPSVPTFKIIILDEADALLPDAQAALRRMMEDYATSTRFIIICNYVSRVIDPITSRCVKYRFRPLPRGIVLSRLEHIAHEEKIVLPCSAEATADFLGQLFDTSGGDMRNAITLLQSVAQYSGVGGVMDSTAACDILNIVPQDVLHTYIQSLFSGSFTNMQQCTAHLLRQGYGASRILAQLLPFLVREQPHITLNNVQRASLCIKMAEVERRLMDGADDYLQLVDLGAAVLAL